MANVTGICNQALSRLGGNLIININDETNEARLCKANYVNVRDIVLEEHQWSFAVARFQLPISIVKDDADQYSNKFLIPPNVINIIRAGDDKDDRHQNSTSWRIEGKYIVSNVDKLYVKAIVRVGDPGLYSPMFIQAVAIRLAAEIAVALTNKVPLQQSLFQEYEFILNKAAQKDGQQGSGERIRSKRYINTRQGGGSYIGSEV